MLDINQLIKEIHESDAYGTILETGCGTAVSSKLLEVEGASKTVHDIYIPYSFDITKQYLQNDKQRAVSLDTVKDLTYAVKTGDLTEYYNNTRTNLIYVSSFQIGNDGITHGYINISYNNNKSFNNNNNLYHITLPNNLTRKEYIDKIGDIGIKLIHKIIFNKDYEFYGENYIDISYDYELYVSYDNDNTLSALQAHKNANINNEHFIYINKNGHIVRPEDELRKHEDICLIRGSFNPIHNGHMMMSKYNKEKHNIFVLTLNAVDKGNVDITDIKLRVSIINELGYDVIVCTKPYYVDLHKEIIRRNPHLKTITYPMGVDTMIRLAKDYDVVYYQDNIKEDEKSNKLIESFNINNTKTTLQIFDRHHLLNENFWWKNNEIIELTIIDHKDFYDLSSTKIRESIEYLKQNIPLQALKNII